MNQMSRRSQRLLRERAAKRRRRYLLWVGAGLLAIVAVVLIVMGLRNASAGAQWQEGETHDHWTVRYTGFGEAVSDGERITLEPQAAQESGITHGGLIHTVGECRDADFSMTLNTESQVRQGDPNVWEVGWVLWNFQSDTHFYAVALKPNGWEISKQDPDYGGKPAVFGIR